MDRTSSPGRIYLQRRPGAASAAREGGRFYHLMGANDKGNREPATRLNGIGRLEQQKGRTLVTVGLGDSLNDLPMLESVDYPILIQKPNGSYDQDVQLPASSVPMEWDRLDGIAA